MNRSFDRSNAPLRDREWIETDGLGGFASGTASGVRTRRYHALLLAATTPPTGRMVLVNGFDAWVEVGRNRFSLSSQCYGPGIIGGDGAQRIESFGWEPWPRWIFRLDDGTRIEFELFAAHAQPMTCLSWKLLEPRPEVRLFVRPFVSGRDYHALHKANPAFRFEATVQADRISWHPYPGSAGSSESPGSPAAPGVPGVTALTNGAYAAEPHWYYNFHYEAERRRGLDADEDLAAPGVFSWNLGNAPAALVFTTTPHAAASLPARIKPLELLNKLRATEQNRRASFPSRLHRAADAYVVRRGEGKTIIAGYPWFTDWGRDTLIALRGVCLATGRMEDAMDILLAWSDAVSEGMLPNRFPDHGGQPEFNAVDASLWYVIAVHEFLKLDDGRTSGKLRRRLLSAVSAIVNGYSSGTRFGIRRDADGLLACGVPGVQLTWMDAKVGDWVVTPRIGKPVEVQALWINALWIASRHDPRWLGPFQQALESFQTRFWNHERRMLFDGIDVDHEPGRNDPAFRPNQIFAVGGLPIRLLDGERASRIVEAVHEQLWTPLGLRSLAPGEPGYAARYEGGVRERDGAYHQGTVWPWLLGAFVDAWVNARNRTPAAIAQARQTFLQPLLDHLETAGLGHVAEIADAEPPHTPRGCPWQAWSVGEAVWIDQVLLAQTK